MRCPVLQHILRSLRLLSLYVHRDRQKVKGKLIKLYNETKEKKDKYFNEENIRYLSEAMAGKDLVDKYTILNLATKENDVSVCSSAGKTLRRCFVRGELCWEGLRQGNPDGQMFLGTQDAAAGPGRRGEAGGAGEQDLAVPDRAPAAELPHQPRYPQVGRHPLAAPANHFLLLTVILCTVIPLSGSTHVTDALGQWERAIRHVTISGKPLVGLSTTTHSNVTLTEISAGQRCEREQLTDQPELFRTNMKPTDKDLEERMVESVVEDEDRKSGTGSGFPGLPYDESQVLSEPWSAAIKSLGIVDKLRRMDFHTVVMAPKNLVCRVTSSDLGNLSNYKRLLTGISNDQAINGISQLCDIRLASGCFLLDAELTFSNMRLGKEAVDLMEDADFKINRELYDLPEAKKGFGDRNDVVFFPVAELVVKMMVHSGYWRY